METDELQYFVINLKGMVVNGWWCGDQEFSVTPEGMVNAIQKEQAVMCLVFTYETIHIKIFFAVTINI